MGEGMETEPRMGTSVARLSLLVLDGGEAERQTLCALTDGSELDLTFAHARDLSAPE
jgi:hypothetical protein